MNLFAKLKKIFKRNPGITVLSLFDGIGGAKLALDRCGIKTKRYFASETDKYAIYQTHINFPEIMQIGDAREVDGKMFPDAGLVIGGVLCQSLCFTGRKDVELPIEPVEVTSLKQYLELKDTGFEFDGQGYLIWEFIRILNEVNTVNPNVKFLLENIGMNEKWENIISDSLGVKPLYINSKVISGQTRRRLYWTNIIDDVNFVDDLTGKYDLFNYLDWETDNAKYCLPPESVEKILDQMSVDSVPKEIARGYWLPYDDYNHKFPKNVNKIGAVRQTFANKAPSNGCKLIRETITGAIEFNDPKHVEVRILKPGECAKLQTFPENYVWDVSERQIYRLLGNCWTIDVVAEILKHLQK